VNQDRDKWHDRTNRDQLCKTAEQHQRHQGNDLQTPTPR
jgi:hypothetical protein